MKITHANQHSWIKSISENLLDNYGKSDRKRINKTLESLEKHGITWEFSIANEAFFKWFTPLYTNELESKNSDRIHDVYSKTVGKEGSVLTYKTLTLFENKTPIGGCVFSCWKDRYSISYRMFKPQWENDSRIASPALFGEYLMDEHTLSNKKIKLVHGQDRNPYGLFSSIGVANFKLAVGCRARLPVKYDEVTTDIDSLDQDTLILHLPKFGKEITEATLILVKNEISKYEQLFSHNTKIHINLIDNQT